MTLPARLQHLFSGKRAAAGCTGLALLALLSPAIENWAATPRDSFPLSYYPMFSLRRDASFSGDTIVAYDGAGARTLVPYRFAGTGGFNQVRRQIRAKVKDGRAGDVCRKVARRIARSGLGAAHPVEVRVIRATVREAEFFAGNRSPAKEVVQASCAVPPARQTLSQASEASR